MERISLLSLSLMLISSFQLQPVCQLWSPILANSDIQQAGGTLGFPAGLCSCGHALLNSLIERWMSERQMIVAGLLLFQLAALCLWSWDYPLIFPESYSLWFGDRNDQCQGYFDYQWTVLRQWQDSDAGLSGVCWSGGLYHLDFYGWTTLTPRLASVLPYGGGYWFYSSISFCPLS